jgi:putative tricarboxylic transport membrane protein
LFIAFTAVDSYTTRNSLFDLAVLIAFGIIGYVCKKIKFPVAPMAFTLILGPLTEKALRQSLSMSGGDMSVLVRGPISTGLMIIAALVLAFPLFRWLWGRLTGRKAIAIPLADN